MIVSSNRHRLAAALVGLVAAAFARAVGAADAPAEAVGETVGQAAAPGPAERVIAVRWSGSSDCERTERVKRRLAEDLDGRVLAAASEIDVRVDGAPGAWRAAFELRGATSVQRSIMAADCDALADAVALVGVVALDPFALTPRVHAAGQALVPLPGDASPAGAIEPSGPPTVRSSQRSRSQVRTREPLHAALRVELGASGFGLPGIGAVVGLAPIIEGDRWRFEVPVRWSLPRQHEVREGVVGRFQLIAANPRGCFVPGRGPVGVPLCAGIDAGAMIARGEGDALSSTSTAATQWVAATLSVAVRWRVHRRFATWLAVEGAVPFGRPAFHVEGLDEAYQAGPATLLVAIGGEVHFPSSSQSARRTKRSRARIVERVHAFRDIRGR